MFRRSNAQKVICSEGHMHRSSYVEKVIYVQKVICSEGFCSEDFMFCSSYVQKVLYSVAAMFKTTYVQKVLVQKVLCSEALILRSLDMFRMSFIEKRETAQTAPQKKMQAAAR